MGYIALLLIISAWYFYDRLGWYAWILVVIACIFFELDIRRKKRAEKNKTPGWLIQAIHLFHEWNRK